VYAFGVWQLNDLLLAEFETELNWLSLAFRQSQRNNVLDSLMF